MTPFKIENRDFNISIMLEVKDLSASKDGQTLFRGVSFTVADGEVAAVSGDQGGSLTLLLHAIMGLYPLDEGHVSIDGEQLTPLSAGEFRKLMAYIPTETPQTGGTVEALLQLPFGLEANRAKPFSRQSLLEEWRLLGLDDGVLRQRVADISVQERQLAMLSLAGVLAKPIVLVDSLAALARTNGEALAADYLLRLAQRGSSVVAAAGSGSFSARFEKRISLTSAVI